MEHTTELDDQDMVGLAFMPNVLSLAREPAPAPAPAPVAAPAAGGQVTEHQRHEFLTWAQTRGGLGRDEAMSVLDRQIRLVGQGRSATGDAFRDAKDHVRQLRAEREQEAAVARQRSGQPTGASAPVVGVMGGGGGGAGQFSTEASVIGAQQGSPSARLDPSLLPHAGGGASAPPAGGGFVPPAEARSATWPHIVKDGTQGTRVTTPCGRVSMDVPQFAAPGSTIQMMVTPTELAILQAAAAQRQ